MLHFHGTFEKKNKKMFSFMIYLTFVAAKVWHLFIWYSYISTTLSIFVCFQFQFRPREKTQTDKNIYVQNTYHNTYKNSLTFNKKFRETNNVCWLLFKCFCFFLYGDVLRLCTMRVRIFCTKIHAKNDKLNALVRKRMCV